LKVLHGGCANRESIKKPSKMIPKSIPDSIKRRYKINHRKRYAEMMKIIAKRDPKGCQHFTKKKQQTKRSPEINRKTIKKLTPTPTTKRRTK
jgi:hypothetical protein